MWTSKDVQAEAQMSILFIRKQAFGLFCTTCRQGPRQACIPPATRSTCRWGNSPTTEHIPTTGWVCTQWECCPGKKHHLLAPALWVCKLLMPVLSVSPKVTASLFVSADKAACVLAWELLESASTRFAWLLGIQRGSCLCSGCCSAAALLK